MNWLSKPSVQQQMEDLQKADQKGDYNTTWKIINAISGQNKRRDPKVKKHDGSAPSRDNEVLNGEKTLLIY